MRILVVRERFYHRILYFDVATQEALEQAALSILTGRSKDHVWNISLTKVPSKPEKGASEFIKDSPTQKYVTKLWDEYHEALRKNKEETGITRMWERAVEEGDGKMALEVLQECKERDSWAWSLEETINAYPS